MARMLDCSTTLVTIPSLIEFVVFGPAEYCEPVAGYMLQLMDHLFLCTNVFTGFEEAAENEQRGSILTERPPICIYTV
ncbi:hypothetical protein DPMN_069488 [Dreissena polymorpha]|uniref:Uncharacterized protein n=1 Tax=Dreissena polymorpha TaxID=45954 RepID=A0A9D3Z486_DREPO|nr:hypothetical protein DPMN_069488 [Dreissena polymorpha]